MTIAPSSPDWLERLRRPRSPRTIALWLALWLADRRQPRALARALPHRRRDVPAFVAALGVFVVVVAAISALMLLTAWGRWMKPVWIAILLAAGVAQHFMLTYGVVMDTTMLANTAQTDPREVRDLLGWTFVANMLLVVAVPAALIAWVPVRRTPWWPQLLVERRALRPRDRRDAGRRVRDVQPARAAGAQQHAPALHRQSDRRLRLGDRGRRRAVLPQEQDAGADHRRHRAGRELRRRRSSRRCWSWSSARRRAPITSRSTATRATPTPSWPRPACSASSDVLSCGTDTRDSVPCMLLAARQDATFDEAQHRAREPARRAAGRRAGRALAR